MNEGTTQASSPVSDSSQTTTEGPDSAVTPSDSSEIVSVQRAEGVSRSSTEGPDMSQSSSMEGPELDTSTYSSSFSLSANSFEKVSIPLSESMTS